MECPSSDNLTQLALGTLDDPSVDEIERHLSDCETCRFSLAKIETSLNDPLSKRLQKSKKANDSKTKSFEHIKIPGFRIVKRIGIGGMGTVYEAVDESSGELRAVKVLHSSRHFDQNAVARFQREKETIARLKHPTIVKSFPYKGDKRTSLCIVMERLQGMDLGEFVKQNGPLPVDQARDFILQAANGLHYAHENGIVHRDIKPSNLFVTDFCSIKILDLGLARLTESETEIANTLTDQIVGTPDYLSPEQAVSPKLIDRRSDIYSLGCTFFYLLTGKAPFDNEETVGGKIAAHARDIAPDVRKIRSDIPLELAAILKKMLEKKPEKRFQNAAEVADALVAKTPPRIFNRFLFVLCVVLLSSICITSVLLSTKNDLAKEEIETAPAPSTMVSAPLDSPAEIPFPDRKIRITYQMDETSKATYRLENQADAQLIPFDGEPFEIPGHPKTKAKRSADGIIQLQYDFADFDENDPYLGCNFDYRLEPPHLVLKNGNKGNIITFAKTLPIFFQCDIDNWTGSPACFVVEEITRNVMSDPTSLSNHLQQTTSQEYSLVSSFRKHGEGERWYLLFPQETTSLRQPYEKSYQLPKDIRFERPLQFHFCQPDGDHFPKGDMKIRRAEFRGRFLEKHIAWQDVELLKQKQRYYRVEGKQIIAPDGKPFTPRGFTVGYWMLDPWISMTTNKQARELKEMGVNCITLTFATDYFPNGIDKETIKEQWKYGNLLNETVNYLTDEGIGVIVALKYIDDKAPPENRVWNDESISDSFMEHWAMVVDELKDNPLVVAWLLHGAADTGDSFSYKSWQNKSFPMLRKLDPFRPIIVNGVGWSNYAQFDDRFLVDDPNVIYSVNVYNFSYDSDVSTIENEISGIFRFRDDNKVPIICGQWGYGPSSPYTISGIKKMLSIFETHRLPWLYHWLCPHRPDLIYRSTNKATPELYELFQEAFLHPEHFDRNSPDFRN